MDHSIHDTLNTFLNKIEKMDRQLQEVSDQVDVNYRDLATRIDRLKTHRRRTTEEENSRNGSRSPRREQVQPYYTADTDAQYIKSVKVDAPSFDGRLDPQVYIDWQLAIDRYFRWHDMSESRKIRLAVMKQQDKRVNIEKILKG